MEARQRAEPRQGMRQRAALRQGVRLQAVRLVPEAQVAAAPVALVVLAVEVPMARAEECAAAEWATSARRSIICPS